MANTTVIRLRTPACLRRLKMAARRLMADEQNQETAWFLSVILIGMSVVVWFLLHYPRP